jgi:hypothetical protein
MSNLHLEADDLPDLAGYQGSLYWRVRLANEHSGASAKISAKSSTKASAQSVGDWSLSRPLVVDMSEPSAIRNRAASQKPFQFQWQSGLFSLSGENGSAPNLIDVTGKHRSRLQRN